MKLVLAMKPSIKYIVSLALLTLTSNVKAQDSLQVQVKDSMQVELIDAIKIDVQDTFTLESNERYFSILIGTDYGKLILTAAQLDVKYEFNIGVQFSNSLRAIIDYGHGELTPSNAIEKGIYTSSGNYYRIGLDYIFKIAPQTYLSLGGMYASSSFKDEGTIEIESQVWPSLSESFTRDGLKASWVEFILTTETTLLNREKGIFNHLYWGAKFRLRFLIERPNPVNFDIYAIPGYGRTWNNLVPAANLFVAYKL